MTFDLDDLQRTVFPGEVRTSIDDAANDSDKLVTVPAGKWWEVLSVWVELVTTATAGSRQLEVAYRDDSDLVVARSPAGATQGTGLTREYVFGGGLPLSTSEVDGLLFAPLPRVILQPGYDIRVRDNAGIDAAADDMKVRIVYAERDV